MRKLKCCPEIYRFSLQLKKLDMNKFSTRSQKVPHTRSPVLFSNFTLKIFSTFMLCVEHDLYPPALRKVKTKEGTLPPQQRHRQGSSPGVEWTAPHGPVLGPEKREAGPCGKRNWTERPLVTISASPAEKRSRTKTRSKNT